MSAAGDAKTREREAKPHRMTDAEFAEHEREVRGMEGRDLDARDAVELWGCADALLIELKRMRAANTHDDLVAALRAMLDAARNDNRGLSAAWELAEAALSQASAS